ncbi:reverse transcriptase domain-containing protein [Tanacetum coccineum]
MPFGLKNVGATYQRLVDKTFDKQVGQNLDVYVDDLVIKSHTETELLRDIEEMFRTLKKINMKLNPKKCTFGAGEGMFMGYMIGPKGIKPCPDKGVATAVHRIAGLARSHFVARLKYLAGGGRRHDLSLGPWELLLFPDSVLERPSWSLDSWHESLLGPLRLGPRFQSHPTQLGYGEGLTSLHPPRSKSPLLASRLLGRMYASQRRWGISLVHPKEEVVLIFQRIKRL